MSIPISNHVSNHIFISMSISNHITKSELNSISNSISISIFNHISIPISICAGRLCGRYPALQVPDAACVSREPTAPSPRERGRAPAATEGRGVIQGTTQTRKGRKSRVDRLLLVHELYQHWRHIFLQVKRPACYGGYCYSYRNEGWSDGAGRRHSQRRRR